jgi:hypothetical protein
MDDRLAHPEFLVEKIFAVAGFVAAINPLSGPDRTMHALLFLQASRHATPAVPSFQ